MNQKRTHVVIPEQLVKEIDLLVGHRRRSSFIAEAAQRELQRVRQHEALVSTAGAWQDEDHPELKSGSAEWVRNMRRESEGRLKKVPRPRKPR